ncbi:hypothetical protein J7T55_002729 [Diaporthe amygdali]|uniref:uncharacterized protein n=1 Tax=Phomopsis amygdali TaxID=1214568 RepID=UPI0022FEA02C|nr:uncharacterized protein J7T55_002729 [Diaporthe amygdali]KAJ0122217.1 hypothetical protein J7T55_002729 [Diaporthe amygdali]
MVGDTTNTENLESHLGTVLERDSGSVEFANWPNAKMDVLALTTYFRMIGRSGYRAMDIMAMTKPAKPFYPEARAHQMDDPGRTAVRLKGISSSPQLQDFHGPLALGGYTDLRCQ